MQYRATILGNIWQPGVGLCATIRDYSAESDLEAMRRAWHAEAGDFSQVKDVHVERFDPCGKCGGRKPVTVKDWENEENKLDAAECLYGDDD